MLCIRYSRFRIDSYKLLTSYLENITNRSPNLKNVDPCASIIVTSSYKRAHQRMIHLARVDKNIKEKDEYQAKLALKQKKDKELVSREFFEDTAEKNRDTFKNAIELFNKRDIRKRGSVEFIYAALKHMKQFDCHR